MMSTRMSRTVSSTSSSTSSRMGVGPGNDELLVVVRRLVGRSRVGVERAGGGAGDGLDRDPGEPGADPAVADQQAVTALGPDREVAGPPGEPGAGGLGRGFLGSPCPD